jgi:hypothetical protein
MSVNFLNHINLNQNELQNAVVQPLATAPANPVVGQIYYNSGAIYVCTVGGATPTWKSISGDIEEITAGTGISVSGGTSGTVTITNSDRGSSQNIFKTFTDGTNNAAADSNTDTFKFRGSNGVTVTVTNDDATHGDNLLISLSSVPNTALANSSVTYTAGSGLTGGGAVSLGGSATINVGAGSGIAVNADDVALKNAASLTNNVLPKWTTASTQLANSLITDDGTTVTIGGNLTVTGTTTYVNSNTVEIGDNILLLNRDVTGTPSENAGLEIERGTSANVSLIWNETTDRWTFSNDGTTFYNIPISTEYNNYVHPTQSAIGLDGGGLSFISDITVNTLGHVTAASLSTIQDGTEAQKGVVELATNAETTTGTSTTLATHPAGVKAAIDAAIAATGFTATIGDGTATSIAVTHSLGSRDVIVQIYDRNTFETVYTEVIRTDINTVTLNFTSAPAASAYSVLIQRVL